MTVEQQPTRRNVYVVMINLLSASIVVALSIPAALYLLTRPRNAESGDWIEVTDLNRLRVGKPEEVLYNRRRTDGWERVTEKAAAWVVRADQRNVIAFNPSCTHLGCAYHWDEGREHFVCPCHGSMFSADGKVFAGPAPRPLDRYASRVDGDKVLIGPQIEKNAI